jgi:hypothetical protein
MGFEKTMVVFLEHIKEIPAPQPMRASPAALRTLLVKADDVFIAARFSSSLIADAGSSPLLRPGCWRTSRAYDHQTNAAKRDVSARPAGRHRDPVARAVR